MWKTEPMKQAYELCIDGAKAPAFNGQVKYETEARAREATAQLRPTLDTEYDLCVVGDTTYVEANGEYYFGVGRLHATEFLQAVADSKPIEAEFEAEDEDGEQYQMNLVDGQWVLLQRAGEYQEVA